MNKYLSRISFFISISLHALLIGLLLFSIETTIRIPAVMPQDEPKEIIDAVMINRQVLDKEIARLQEKENKKRAEELARKRELERKQKEAIEKRKKEEKLMAELKKKNEQLKKEAEAQRIAKEKEEKEEKARLAKIKKEQEEERKKLEKQKEEALAQKKKIEAEQKEAEERARQQANIKIKQNQITQHAMLIKNKIHRNWRQPVGFDFREFTCEIEVKLLPTGEVANTTVIKRSGNVEFDRSAELAIQKASPLPMPSDEALAKEFRQFTFTFRPEVV